MCALSFPRRPGRLVAALAAGLAAAAFLCLPPAASGDTPAASDQPAAVPHFNDQLHDVEHDALLARAQSLESLGQYLWTNNMSASRARLRAWELRQMANLLVRDAREELERAGTSEERAASERRLEIITGTSVVLGEAADRISMTRGVRRKLRVLALDLSREAWHVVRRNDLRLLDDALLVPGRLFKENEPASHPRERALLREPAVDYLTYNRGAVDSDVLERRTFERVSRAVEPVPEEAFYYSEGAITLSPLDRDFRSQRIWWSPPPEELAWRVEQW